MSTRLDVLKTYKLYIDGKFPRSESGRSWPVEDAAGRVLAHLCRASRKDLREAVEAARRAQPAWAAATAYLRGQILYRIAEMVEGKRDELAASIDAVRGAARAGRAEARSSEKRSGTLPRGVAAPGGAAEVAASIDRLVHYAGWSDKFSQVLGCHNAVAGPFYNFTFAEPTGTVGVVCPNEAPLLALVSLLAPAICAGNTAVIIASSTNPIPAAIFAEACATGDVPAGVLNILTGDRAELLPSLAVHRDLDAIHAGNLPAAQAAMLREGVAENIKRVTVRGDKTPVDWFDTAACHSPWWIEPLVEMKTVWHPASA